MSDRDPREVREGLEAARRELERTTPRGSARTPAEIAADLQAGGIPISEDDIRSTQTERINAAWDAAVPRRFRSASLTTIEPEIAAAVCEWLTEDPTAGRWENPLPNLLITGPVGTLKTSAACAAGRVLVDRRALVEFVPVIEMLLYLRPGGPERFLERMLQADVLIMDDLGQERATEWAYEQVELIVNRRWLDQRPIVATTNLEPDDLAAAVGPRIFSRLVGAGAVGIRTSGEDRRRASNA